jgi:hypothetical protein
VFLRFEFDNNPRSLIDTDFVVSGLHNHWFVDDVIDVYEARDLNVAANLVLMFRWGAGHLGWILDGKAGQVMCNARKYCPRYAKYAEAVERYLLLI